MKKIHIAGLALVAVAAFFAVSIASASAIEWLVGGSAATEGTSVQTKGLLTLTDLKASFLGASAVDCEGTFVGTVGPAGKDAITEIIGTEGKTTKGNGLAGETFVECKGVEGCEKNGKVYPLGMPWKTQLELTTALIDNTTPGTGTTMGYAIECSIFGIKEEDECTQALFAPVVHNGTNNVIGLVAEENASHCSLSGENSGDAKGEGTTTTLSGASLQISGE